MSFRELRDFTEIMRALGYRQLISVENFRTPNFPLMADVLFWLVHRYDDSAELSPDIDTEDKRIAFLKAVAQFMANKAQVRLNIKQLYRADGFAVRELLKICRILYNAVQVHPSEVDESQASSRDSSVNSKLDELRDSKDLAAEIVASGAKLNTLLSNEEKLKVARDRALKFLDSISLNLDSDSHDQIERNIRQEINLITERIAEYEKLIADLESDEKAFKVKIEKKKRALIGAEKRLRSLKKVRPDYMEDYEQMEAELKAEYETYLERFRNLYYLESQLEKYHKQEAERKADADKQLKRMQRRLRQAAEAEQNGTEAGFGDSSEEEGRNQPLRRRNQQARPNLDADDTEESSEEEDSDDALKPRTNLTGESDDEEFYDERDNPDDSDDSLGPPGSASEDDEEDYDDDDNDGYV